VRPWMTIRYIANSTGVPESYLLEQLELPAEHESYPFQPLDKLADTLAYPGGPQALLDKVQQSLNEYPE